MMDIEELEMNEFFDQIFRDPDEDSQACEAFVAQIPSHQSIPDQSMHVDDDDAARLHNLQVPEPPLGLPLVKSLSFAESLIGINLDLNMSSQIDSLSAKFKATNFPITLIKIGAWQLNSVHEGHITAKIYYGKRKLVWEVLEGELKRKMEIAWSDITAISAVMLQNQPGTLQIELARPPLFFMETPPTAKKHTIWESTLDFTNGEASIYRRHTIIFPGGELDQHYRELLQYDQQLYQISLKPFPSNICPFFNGPFQYHNNYHF